MKSESFGYRLSGSVKINIKFRVKLIAIMKYKVLSELPFFIMWWQGLTWGNIQKPPYKCNKPTCITCYSFLISTYHMILNILILIYISTNILFIHSCERLFHANLVVLMVICLMLCIMISRWWLKLTRTYHAIDNTYIMNSTPLWSSPHYISWGPGSIPRATRFSEK
jgi:hypothetical protein